MNQKTAQGTSLHLAALFGKVDVVKLLIEVIFLHKIQFHITRKMKFTPFISRDVLTK